MARRPSTFSSLRLPLPPPMGRRNPAYASIRAPKVMPNAIDAATEAVRMSRLRTWLISCAKTPRSSDQLQIWRMP